MVPLFPGNNSSRTVIESFNLFLSATAFSFSIFSFFILSSSDFASISNLRVTSPSKSLAETVTLFLLKSAFNFNSLSFSVGTFATIASLIAASIFSLLLLSCSATCTFPKSLPVIDFNVSLSFGFATDFASISNLRVTSPSKSLAETVTLFLLKSAFNFNSLSFSVGTFVTIASLIATSIFSLLLLSCSATCTFPKSLPVIDFNVSLSFRFCYWILLQSQI
ncbi:hypothetical protein HYD58_03775 [Mycoplasmopsis bovis]|nr:hypothetical protein [Mycoplasmopsis bovis]QQH66183.1 hypothetical protein HYD58_03775 [Mycoplasmopsis bovis]